MGSLEQAVKSTMHRLKSRGELMGGPPARPSTRKPRLFYPARPPQPSNWRSVDAVRFQPSALSFRRKFFASCKEVSDKESISQYMSPGDKPLWGSRVMGKMKRNRIQIRLYHVAAYPPAGAAEDSPRLPIRRDYAALGSQGE